MIQKFEFCNTDFEGAYLIKPFCATDIRGAFIKDYSKEVFEANGLEHNLAVIIEVAAMNNSQKKMGYNAARELLKNLGMAVEDLPPSPKVIVDTWE